MVIRVVDLPQGRAGASVLRRLADLRVLRHPGLVTVREVVSLPEHRAGVIMTSSKERDSTWSWGHGEG